ncbi:MAG: DUF4330 family protein [Clostridia bacterium]|nr:DUF4330 family protein [Clostridia bacterium]
MSSANRGRGKYRFNIIDILLIVVIAISVASILFLYFYDGKISKNENDVNSVDIIYTVSQKEIPSILRGKINIGDLVTEEGNLSEIGQVIDVEYTDSVYSGYDSENNRFEELYPGKIDVKIRISAKAIVDENGIYRVNGYMLNIGKEATIMFPYYVGDAVIVSISEVSE